MIIQGFNIIKEIKGIKLFDIPQLNISKKQRVALIGLNGSGKTSLVKGIMDERLLTSGHIKKYGRIAYIDQSNIASNQSLGERQWQKLSAVFKEHYDLIILDEPTNHLDLVHIQALKKYINEFNGAFIIISHDHSLLEDCCDVVWALKNGRFTTFNGKLSDYMHTQKLEIARQASLYQKQQAKRSAIEVSIKNHHQTSDKMKKTPSRMGNSESRLHKGEARNRQGKLAKRVNALQSKLEQLEDIKKPFEEKSIVLKQKAKPIQSKVLFSFNHFNLTEPKLLLKDVKLSFENHKKVCLIGDNGSGKTSLVQTIVKRNPQIRYHPNLKIGFYVQDDRYLDATLSVYDTLKNLDMNDIEVRSILKRLHFNNHDFDKSVSVLSGGEYAKLKLATLLLGEYHLLILDEPTNHLDIEVVEALEVMLQSYQGSLLVISHQERLIKSIANEIWSIKDQQLHVFKGDYQSYLNNFNKEDYSIVALELAFAKLSYELMQTNDEGRKAVINNELDQVIDRLRYLKKNV